MRPIRFIHATRLPPHLQIWVLQGLIGCQALLRVDGKHLRDQVLRFGADVGPVLVVEAVHALLDLGEQSRL